MQTQSLRSVATLVALDFRATRPRTAKVVVEKCGIGYRIQCKDNGDYAIVRPRNGGDKPRPYPVVVMFVRDRARDVSEEFAGGE